jgi:hypothetical protein
VCPFEKILPSKQQIITKNRNALVKAEGACCNGFTFGVSLQEKSYKYSLPCPHSKTMSVETGVLNRKTGYFNGTDFLCEILKANIVINPTVSTKRPPRAFWNMQWDMLGFVLELTFIFTLCALQFVVKTATE